jgi:uncharacterized protein YcgI (DUF1989 family)
MASVWKGCRRRHPSYHHVELEAEMDCVVVLSACPHDIFPVNGVDCTPKDVAYSIR